MSHGHLFGLNEQALRGQAPQFGQSCWKAPKSSRRVPGQWRKPLLMTIMQSDVPPHPAMGFSLSWGALLTPLRHRCVCQCIPFPKDMGWNLGGAASCPKCRKCTKVKHPLVSNILVCFLPFFSPVHCHFPLYLIFFPCHYKTPWTALKGLQYIRLCRNNIVYGIIFQLF